MATPHRLKASRRRDLGDVDDDGYAATGTFLSFFVEHFGGLVQADAEGFYEGDELIVALE